MRPDFIGIGAAKSGTSSLYHYLAQHPDIFMPTIKETNYFAYYPGVDQTRNIFSVRDWDSYQALFDQAGNKIAGEVSPLYLESSVAAQNIYERLPDAKLIAILRNPVDRAYSGYQMQVRKNRELDSIKDALSPESHVVQVGLYYEKLLPYYERFSHIRVYRFEDFVSNTVSVMQDIFSFIGVDNQFVIEPEAKNTGGLPKSKVVNRMLSNSQLKRLMKPIASSAMRNIVKKLERNNLEKAEPLPDDIRATLTNFYKEDIQKLENLAGLDLSNWLS